MNKKMIFAASLTFMSAAQTYAATYDSATHQITLNNIQGINNGTPNFNISALLEPTDGKALHNGQIFKAKNTLPAVGSPDARYTATEGKLFIPNLTQDASTIYSVTLLLTNPAGVELTVTDLNTTTFGNNSTGVQGQKGDTGPQGPQGLAGSFPAGTAKGDMQYWDGTKWTMIPAGSNGAYLVFCDGKPVWGTCKTTPTPAPTPVGAYKIGSTGPAGGVVFYVDSSGAHGLEAQKEDLYGGKFTWSGAKVELANYPGWRLPTQDELPLMYAQKQVIGLIAINWGIWSSTEVDSNRAWVLQISGGNVVPFDKDNVYLVRAVRNF
jgi:hypothetical protein